MENVNTTTNEKETRKPLEAVVRPEPFNPVGEVALSTTDELCNMINSIFSDMFEDYYGCNIVVQFNQATSQFIINPFLYFNIMRNYDDNHDYAFKPLAVEAKHDSPATRVQRVTSIAASNGPKMFITEDLKNIAKNFVLGDPEKFDWKTCYSAHVQGDLALVKMFKLDILKLLRIIYGENDGNGGKLYYQPSIIRQIRHQVYGKPDNWAVSILRLNETNEARAAEKQGIIMPNNGAPMSIVAAKK